VKPGSDAAVFHVKYADKILAATTDCNSLYCALDPREGSRIAVAEAARNLTCSGARPLAVTDNLNFGNPYKPENFWQLRESVEGLAEACRAFGTPVVGGNVSLYNESPAGVVDPTPTVGMVGLIDDKSYITTQWFKETGDVIILVGPVTTSSDPTANLGASRYLKVCHGLKQGPVPRLDLAQEIAVQKTVRNLIQQGLVRSAHDCSEGGLAVALAECCFNPASSLGAQIDLASIDRSFLGQTDTVTLFHEGQSRIVLSVHAAKSQEALHQLQMAGVAAGEIGRVGHDSLFIKLGQNELRWPIADLHDNWWNAIARALQGDSESEPLPQR
jgi:phosphoribosylformylglycinamidine synthase